MLTRNLNSSNENAVGRSSAAAVITILIVLAVVPAQAAFMSVGSCPANIIAPGNYQLTADLACTVTISASNVSLKLNGHVITLNWDPSMGQTGQDGINVAGAGRLNHVAIEGPGLIQSAFVGIDLADNDYSQVSLVTIRNSYDGIVATGNTFLTLGSNVIGQEAGAGIAVKSSTFSTVAGNDVTGVGNGALSIEGSATFNVTVNNNTFSGNGVAGIVVLAGSGVRIYGNVANGNGQVGIEVLSPGNEVFSNTSVRANGGVDLRDSSPLCSGNAWSDNVFQVASAACIH